MWYVTPCLIGFGYWLSYFFFDYPLPASRYVLGISRILTIFILFLLIDRLHRYDGHLVIKAEKGKTLYSLDLDLPIQEIEEREIIHFKVQDHRPNWSSQDNLPL